MHCPQAFLARQQSSLTASSRSSTKTTTQPRRHALRSNLPIVCTSVVDKDPASEGTHVERAPSVNSAAATANNTAAGGVHNNLIRAPEDFTLPPGQLSTVDRNVEVAQQDIYRCAGCTATACQVCLGQRRSLWMSSHKCVEWLCLHTQGPTGCAENQWRLDPTGYVKEVLMAKVYDVAVRTRR